MAKYAIIKKDTGQFYLSPTILDDMARPINEDELAYAELSDTLVDALTTFEKVIDTNQTFYRNGIWTEIYKTPPKPDMLANRTRDKNIFLNEAQRRLSVPDISDSFKTILQNYITELEAITPTSNEEQQIAWPTKPF